MAAIEPRESSWSEEIPSSAATRFATLFQFAPVGVCLVSFEDQRILDANAAFSDLIGYESHEIVGKAISELQFWADGKERKIIIELLERSGFVDGVEVTLRRKDGEQRDVLLAMRLMDVGQKQIIATAVDLTEQKQVQRERERLREEREAALMREKLILDTMPIACTVIDSNGRYAYWNLAAQRTFGYAVKEVIGRCPTELIVPAERRDDVKALLAEVMAGKSCTSPVVINARKDGSQLKCIWSLAPLGIAADANFGGAIVMAQDVTQREAAEDQLRQSQRIEAIGQLTGGVAHDFNNLLLVILGNAQLLHDDLPDGDERRDYAVKIESAAQRGAALTHRLLAFSRRQILAPKPINLGQVVSEMIDLITRTLGETIDVRLTVAPGIWIVQADPSQMESVVLNLAVNARDAMPDGGMLSIETRNVHLDAAHRATHPYVIPGDYVMLAVSDTGVGMAPDVLKRAFEPFFTTKEPGKGTGLGLSMIYGFVKQSGGNVDIYSEPGNGTTVRVYLPRDAAASQAKAKGDKRQELPAGSPQERILVVEDNAPVRDLIVRQLKSLSYSVREAHNGPSALDILEKDDAFDLLLTDLVMPGGMNGRELAERAKRLHPALKIVFTSGYTEDVVIRAAGASGTATLLSKPFTRRELAGKIRGVLDS